MNCVECGEPVDIKSGDTIDTNVGPMKPGRDPGPYCRAYLSTGWCDDPMRVQQDILNDPDLRGKIEIKSPIQPEDL
jgi:hypothetical protein